MAQATESPTTTRVTFSSASAVRRHPSTDVEIPQPPRSAFQRLVGENWETITFDDREEDDPYYRAPLLYQSRYVAEHVAKAYSDETVRVHEIGGV